MKKRKLRKPRKLGEHMGRMECPHGTPYQHETLYCPVCLREAIQGEGDVIHKTKNWYNLTHWEKPNKSKCGRRGVTRWRWSQVTCERCLKWKITRKEN